MASVSFIEGESHESWGKGKAGNKEEDKRKE